MISKSPEFVLRLQDEHELFLKTFDRLFAFAASQPNWRETVEALAEFCRSFLEDFHHWKEEELLFPILARDPRIHAGGPECVLHYDLQMRSPPREFALKICETLGVELPPTSRNPLHLRWRQEHSPILIPVEDHEAGRILLDGLDVVLLDSEAKVNALRILEAYRDLQGRSVRKENGCLFCLARTLVPGETWKDLESREPSWLPERLHPIVINAVAESSFEMAATSRAGGR